MTGSSRRDFIKRTALVTGSMAAAGAPVVAASAENTNSSNPISKSARLRELLAEPGVTVIPEAYTVYTARLAELAGFPAIYAGGNMIAGMHFGIEDWGLVDLAELVEVGGRIAGGVSVPAIVDADQGGETSLNVYRSVERYERAGIAGSHIEDTRNPKHLGPGRSELMPVEEMVERIKAAVEGRSDPNYVIIARSDCLWIGSNPGDHREAIRRGNAFAEAGADAFFVVSMRSDQVQEIASNIPIPLIALNIPVDEVRDTSCSIDIHGVQVYQAAASLYQTMLGELRSDGQFKRGPERRLDPDIVAQVLDIPEYSELADRWSQLKG